MLRFFRHSKESRRCRECHRIIERGQAYFREYRVRGVGPGRHYEAWGAYHVECVQSASMRFNLKGE